MILRYGSICTMGDTDAVCSTLAYPKSIKGDVHAVVKYQLETAHMAASDITAATIRPNEDEVEAHMCPIAISCKKKVYMGLEHHAHDHEMKNPELVIKGMSAKKRSACIKVRRSVAPLAMSVLKGDPPSTTMVIIQDMLASLTDRPTRDQIEDYIITCNYNEDVKSDEVIGVFMAESIQKFTGVTQKPGRRLPFVFQQVNDPNAKRYTKAVYPEQFLATKGARLDLRYYIEMQIGRNYEQLFDMFPEHKKTLNRLISSASVSYQQKRCGQRRLGDLFKIHQPTVH